MASKYGRNAFTVQEATNSSAYATYKCEVLTLSGATGQSNTNSWASAPAKEIVIFSQGSVADDDGITIAFKIAGSYGHDIVINTEQLPFTIKGLLIEEITIHGDGSGTDNDALTVLSFH